MKYRKLHAIVSKRALNYRVVGPSMTVPEHHASPKTGASMYEVEFVNGSKRRMSGRAIDAHERTLAAANAFADEFKPGTVVAGYIAPGVHPYIAGSYIGEVVRVYPFDKRADVKTRTGFTIEDAISIVTTTREAYYEGVIACMEDYELLRKHNPPGTDLSADRPRLIPS